MLNIITQIIDAGIYIFALVQVCKSKEPMGKTDWLLWAIMAQLLMISVRIGG